jgi:hypothetical protein
MIIANPIYDVVFKRMMENEKVAKFFIGTLLGEDIETIEVKPQEYTYDGEIDVNDPTMREALEKRVMERLSIRVYRLDFVATIKTESGEVKKILIEIQKANNEIDLMRFRNYLGEQYKKEDNINNKRVILPITTIYILGFKLPEIDTPCLKVERNYRDLINQKNIPNKSDFVEKLSHDSFVVQVERITGRYQTRLDKLLSVFEQSNFIDDKKIIKEFKHIPDDDDLMTMTDILHHSGTNPEEKKKIEDEQEAIRTINALLENVMDKIKEKDLTIKEKDLTIKEKDQAIEQMKKEMEELKRQLDSKKQ